MYNNSIETKEVNSIYFKLLIYIRHHPLMVLAVVSFFNMKEGEQVVKCTGHIYAKHAEVILY